MAKKKSAKKPEFKVPAATGTAKDATDRKRAEGTDAGHAVGVATEDSRPVEGTGEHEVTVEMAPPAAPGQRAVWELELVPCLETRTARRLRIDRHMSVRAANGGGRVRESLRRQPEETLANGRYLDGNSTAQALQLLLERLADPRVKRVVFLTE
jgi:hypothetical protein